MPPFEYFDFGTCFIRHLLFIVFFLFKHNYPFADNCVRLIFEIKYKIEILNYYIFLTGR